jgi:hypothetical protein
MSCATTSFRILAINDGAAFFRDLGPTSARNTAEFILQCFDVFRRVNAADRGAGFWGARLVIAAGHRIRDSRQPLMNPHHVETIVRRLRQEGVSAEQAVHDAFHARAIFGSTYEIQANFAFARAYLADSDGSRAGLGGPTCFMDDALLDASSAGWLSFGRTVPWTQPGLRVNFLEVTAANRSQAIAARYAGARGATAVSTYIHDRDAPSNDR